jgi:hypothetical protein
MFSLMEWPATAGEITEIRVSHHARERFDERGGSGRGDLRDRLSRARLQGTEAGRFSGRTASMASYRSGKLVFLLVARGESSAVLLTVRAQRGRYSQQNAKERKREHKRRVARGQR